MDIDFTVTSKEAEDEILRIGAELDKLCDTEFWKDFVSSLLDEIEKAYRLLAQTTIIHKDTGEKVFNDLEWTQYIRGMIEGMWKVLAVIKGLITERDIIKERREVK